MSNLRKYGESTTIKFPLIDYGGTDFELTPVTHSTGDSQISKDEGAFANTSNSFTYEGNGIYSLTLTAVEMQASRITLTIIDQNSVKEWEDQAIEIETYGNASAQHSFDLDTATQDVNVSQISGDSTAANNLESQYDGTGLIGGTFPAYQSQISGIASGSAAINAVAYDGIVATGTVNSGTYASTANPDGVYWEIEQATNAMSLTASFNIGTTGVPNGIKLTGRLYDPPVTTPDILDVEAYNYQTTAWDKIGIITGVNSSTDQVHTFDLTNQQVDDTTVPGRVLIRFTNQGVFGTGTIFYIDQILCSYAVVSSPIGYQNGAVWIDTNNGTPGSVANVNGTADNPVSTWSDAKFIATAIGLTKFEVVNGSSITLDSDSSGFTLHGDAWDLALGGQTIDSMVVFGAEITGTGNIVTNHADFYDCHINAATIGESHFYNCGFGYNSGTFTAGGNGQYVLYKCYSMVPGSGSPDLDFDTNITATTGINNRGYYGGATWYLNSNCTLSHETVAGGGTTITSSGAIIEIRGTTRSIDLTLSGAGTIQFVGVTGDISVTGTTTATINLFGVSSSVTDTSSAATITDNTISVANAADGVWDEVITKSTHDVSNSAGKRLRLIGSAAIVSGDVVSSTSNTVVLDANASSVDGAYDPAMISIFTGTGAGQTRLVLEYNGTTKTAVVDRNWKTNPDATSEYVITPHPGRQHVNEGLAQTGTANTITLNALASSVDDAYKNQMIFLRSGTGEDQIRRVVSYVGSTKIATVSENWGTVPDSTTGYAMIPMTCVETQSIVDGTIKKTTFDNSTAYAVESVDSGSTQIARKGSGAYDLTTITAYINSIETDIGDILTSVDAILIDTNELQTNQGNWLTATGFATAAALATAQTDLDTITGADGVTLATLQPNYAPNTVVPDAAGTAPTASEIVTAIMADTSVTNGSIAFSSVMQIVASACAGGLTSSAGTYSYKDISDGVEVYNIDMDSTSPHRGTPTIA